MPLWETSDHRRRQESARLYVEHEMRVKATDIPMRGRGSHSGDWILSRGGKPLAVAEYKFRTYVPSSWGWHWKVDVAKVDAVREHARKLSAIPLFVVETCDERDRFKNGMPCTYNVVTATVLRTGYKIGSMTLNAPREDADVDDAVYLVPDREMASLHILAAELWPEI